MKVGVSLAADAKENGADELPEGLGADAALPKVNGLKDVDVVLADLGLVGAGWVTRASEGGGLAPKSGVWEDS